jgi:HAD superfamily hydrolase (TIGR01509 family)
MTGRTLWQIASSTRHLFLDFDGPICAVFAGVANSTVAGQLRDSLHAAGIPVPVEVEGEPDPLEVFQAVATVSPEAAATAQQLLAAFEARAVATAKPTPGSADLIITAYRTRRTVTIVSNNSEAAIRAYLSDHRLSDYVRAVLGRDHDPGKMKPSPYRVRMAVMSLGTDPRECMFVGDSPTDVIAGRLAGVPVIGCANKPGKADTLTRAQADAVTTDLADISAAFRAGAGITKETTPGER